MTVLKTFMALRDFWRDAYMRLDITSPSDAESVLKDWVSSVLTNDGLALDSPLRRIFSAKPPEPFFGKWIDAGGNLALHGKTVVVLINPGDGISYEQCVDKRISNVGRAHWELLKEFYTTGVIAGRTKAHHLFYSRALRNTDYDYTVNGRAFAWGWWVSQWDNMLRAVGGNDEGEVFVTLELIAYSTKTANELTLETVKALQSSHLVCSLIIDLLSMVDGSPRQIVLVNKRDIWRDILSAHGYHLVAYPLVDSRGNPRAYRLHGSQGPTSVPLVVLSGAQGMKFPTPYSGAPLVFQ